MSAPRPGKVLHDPLHVDVPNYLVDALKVEVQEDIEQRRRVADEMVWALGGEPRVWEVSE